MPNEDETADVAPATDPVLTPLPNDDPEVIPVDDLPDNGEDGTDPTEGDPSSRSSGIPDEAK